MVDISNEETKDHESIVIVKKALKNDCNWKHLTVFHFEYRENMVTKLEIREVWIDYEERTADEERGFSIHNLVLE